MLIMSIARLAVPAGALAVTWLFGRLMLADAGCYSITASFSASCCYGYRNLVQFSNITASKKFPKITASDALDSTSDQPPGSGLRQHRLDRSDARGLRGELGVGGGAQCFDPGIGGLHGGGALDRHFLDIGQRR